MKKLILPIIVLLVITGLVIFYKQSLDPRSREELIATNVEQANLEKKTRATSCTSTRWSKCAVYECKSGYIYAYPAPAPGTNPLRCTSGELIEVK